MSNFIISADVNCDLNDELAKEYDIEILPGHIVTPTQADMLVYPNWEAFSSMEKFYSDLSANPDMFATSPPNARECADLFERFVKDGKEVLHLCISSGISGAFDFATQAKNEVMKKYPEAKIRVVDSMRFGPGFGLMVIYAATKRNEGCSMDEVCDYIEENKNRFHQAGWLDDLSFVAKKGRLTHAKAFFGTLAGVKPIGEFDYNGLTTVIGKFKGAKSAYKGLLHYIEKTIENPEEQIIFIAQSNRYEAAVKYKEMIEEKFHPKAVVIKDLYASCGVNVGPGLMAAYYVGLPISGDLSFEKKIIDDYLTKES